ncbi:hypothetical protein EFW58_01537 [Bacillus velezensis]|nr:hypothetical protein EFW58_01537 [Bacillus velezensis]
MSKKTPIKSRENADKKPTKRGIKWVLFLAAVCHTIETRRKRT